MTSPQPWCQKEKVKKKTRALGLFLCFFYRTLEIISEFVFWLMYRNAKKQVLPPIDNLLLLESASSLALKIRTKKVILFFYVIVMMKPLKLINSSSSGD